MRAQDNVNIQIIGIQRRETAEIGKTAKTLIYKYKHRRQLSDQDKVNDFNLKEHNPDPDPNPL